MSLSDQALQTPNRVVSVRHMLPCPSCAADVFDVTHLMDQETSAGPWFCHCCGHSVRVAATGNGEFSLRPHNECRRLTFDLLRRRNGQGYVYIVVRGLRIVRTDLPSEDEFGHSQYFYEEHTCPTNFLRDVVAVVSREGLVTDYDPHGLFEFVGSADRDDGQSDISDAEIHALFGKIIEEDVKD